MYLVGCTLNKVDYIENNLKYQIKRASRTYLKIGITLLFISLILSITLIIYSYDITEKYEFNNLIVNEKLKYHNITNIPNGYVIKLDYKVRLRNNSRLNVFLIFFSEENISFKLKRLNFTNNISTGTIRLSSFLSKIVLALNSTNNQIIDLDIEVKYYLKPSYFNIMSLLCLVIAVISIVLSFKGLIYFLMSK